MSARSAGFQEEVLNTSNFLVPLSLSSTVLDDETATHRRGEESLGCTEYQPGRQQRMEKLQKTDTCKDQSANNSQQNTKNWKLSRCCQKRSHQLASKFSKKNCKKSKHGKQSDAGMPTDTGGNFPLPSHEAGKNFSQHLI